MIPAPARSQVLPVVFIGRPQRQRGIQSTV